jgi:MFS family permease
MRRFFMGARVPANAWLVVFCPFAAGYYLSHFYRYVNAVIAKDLVQDFGLAPGDLGLLTSAYFLAFAAFQLPLGVLLDRFGPRPLRRRADVRRRCGRADVWPGARPRHAFRRARAYRARRLRRTAYALLTQLVPAAQTGRVTTSSNVLLFGTSFVFRWGVGAVLGLWPTGAGVDTPLHSPKSSNYSNDRTTEDPPLSAAHTPSQTAGFGLRERPHPRAKVGAELYDPRERDI